MPANLTISPRFKKLRNKGLQRSSKRGRSSFRRKMFLEQLEPRQLLASVAWNVDSDGFWDVGSNWSTGSVPGGGDDVTINRPGGSFTVTIRDGFGTQNVRTLSTSSDEGINIAGAGLYIDQTSTVAAHVTLTNAFWQTGNLVTVTGPFNWNSGTITGSTTAIAASGDLTIAGTGGKTLNGGGLSIFGTVHHTGIGQFDANSAITIQPGGIYQLESDATIGAGGRIINAGTVRKAAGVGEALFDKPFDNNGGTIESSSGVLSLGKGGDWNSGTLNAGAGAIVNLSGPNTFNWVGSFTGSGAGKVFLNASMTTQVPSATIDFPAGLFEWIGGAIFSHPTRPVNNSGTITLAGAATKQWHGVFFNSGTVVLKDSGNFDLVGGSPTFLDNLAGGLFDIQSDADTNFGDINNAGILRKSGGSGESILGSRVNNLGGIIDVQIGKLTLGGANGSSTGGTFNVAPGAVLDLTGGASPVVYSGNYTGSGGGRVEMSGGWLSAIGANFNFPVGMFHQTGGVIYGGGGANSFTNAGEMTISGPGDKRIGGNWNNTGTIIHTGGSFLIDNGTNYLNSGLYDFAGDGLIFAFSHQFGGNHASASSGIIRKSAGTGTSTIGDGAMNFRFLGGTVEVLSGTLKIDRTGGDASTGATFNVAAGASVDWVSAGSYSGVYAGMGEGQVHISGDWLPLSPGAIWNFVPGMLDFAGGNISSTPHGYSDLTNRGEVTFVGPDGRNIARNFFNEGKIIHTGTGGLTLASGRLTNYGTYEVQSDATMNLGTFDNKGTLTKTAGSGTFKFDTFNSAFNSDRGRIEVHSGIIEFAATGEWNEATIVTDAGTSVVLSGNVKGWRGKFSGSGTGVVEVTSAAINGNDSSNPAHLDFPEGMFQMSGGQLLGDIVNDNFLMLTTSTGIFARALIKNAGTIIHSGSGDLVLNANSRFENSGLYDMRSDGDFVSPNDGSGGTVLFVNTGRLLKSNGLGTSSFRHDGTGRAMKLDNKGILEIRTGTFTFNDNVVQMSGTTLNAGTWIVGSFSTLTIPPASNIAINKANVTLDGPNSVFTNFSALNNNQGSLSLLNGRDLATGALANSGSITLGKGSQLTVTGALTQSGHNQLNFQIGDTPGSGQFGSLTTTTAANLQGAIRVQLVDGYGPVQNDTYQLAGYASRTGTNPVIAGLEPFFSASLTGTAFTVTATDSATDLAVNPFVAPLTGGPGQNVTVPFTVSNQTLNAISGDWVDSVFLSRDVTLSIDDQLLGRSLHAGGLSPLGLYAGSVTAPLPGLPTGEYYVIVSADSSRNVPDTVRGNNVVAASTRISVDVPALAFGVTTAGTVANEQDVYYKLDVPAGGDVILTANFAAVSEAEFFVKYRDVPTRSNWDFTASNLTELQRKITLASPQAGPYYILIHGREGAGAGTAFDLRADHIAFAVNSLTPSRGSNRGSVTATIKGAGFTNQTTVSLIGPGGTRAASEVLLQDNNTIVALFNLSGLTTGAYDVKAVTGVQETTLDDGFMVTNGPMGKLVTRVSAPGRVRPGREGRITIEYSNEGETNITAPLMDLVADNALMRLPENPTFHSEYLPILGINPTGPAGVLPPGFRGTLQVIMTPNGGVGTEFHLFFPAGSTVINWNDMKGAYRPPTVPAEAWDAIWANFLTDVGTTMAQYNTLLANMATYLGQIEPATYDPDRLLQFALRAADGFGEISTRYQISSLGRGRRDETTILASTAANGDVTISYGGSPRFFRKQTDGSYLGVNGDLGILKVISGHYELRDKNGTRTVFRTDGKWDFTEDTNGNRMTAAYSGNLVTSVTDSLGDTVAYAYNAAGRLVQMTDEVGRITTYSYDAANQHLLSMTNQYGTTSYAYVTGQGAAREHAVASITYPDGTSDQFLYDARGRISRTTRDGGASPIDYSYGAAGTATMTDSTGASITSLVNEYGKTERYVGMTATNLNYDRSGNLASAIGPGGARQTNTFDSRQNIVASIDPLGQVTSTNYESAFNRLSTVRDARGNTVQFTRDQKGRLLSVTYPDGSSGSMTYDPRGNIISATSAGNERTDSTYNSKDLLNQVKFDDGTSLSYTYDAHRNMIAIVDETGATTRLTYDAQDRVTRITYPGGKYLDYFYDAFSRRIRVADQAGFAVNYEYDSVGRLWKVKDTAGNLVVTYAYDSRNRLQRETRAGGTYTTYTYDAAGDIVDLIHRAADDSITAGFHYDRDERGNPVSVASLDGTTTYDYDLIGQLVGAHLPGGREITYEYDALGNRIRMTDSGVPSDYATNNLNQYTAAGTATFTYDADGNLKTRTDAGGTTTYSYNARGLLAGISSPTDTWSFEYDALRQRRASVHNGVRTEYLVDFSGHGDVFAEYDSLGALTAHYTHGNGLVNRVDVASIPSFFTYDVTGNTVQIATASGTIQNRYSYLPFGEKLSEVEGLPNDFTYGGRLGVMEVSPGTYYMRNRYYDANLGRFLSRDPLSLVAGDLNLYRYAGNDPVSKADPTGLIPVPTNLGQASSTNPLPGIWDEVADSFDDMISSTRRLTNGRTLDFRAQQADIARSNLDYLNKALGRLRNGGIDTSKLESLLAEHGKAAQAAISKYEDDVAKVTEKLTQRYAPNIPKPPTPGQQVLNGLKKVGTPAMVASAVADPSVGEWYGNWENSGNGSPFGPAAADAVDARQLPLENATDAANLALLCNSLAGIEGTAVGYVIIASSAGGPVGVAAGVTGALISAEALRLLCFGMTFIQSADPNEIVGPEGFGTDHSVSESTLLPYEIHFENKATATASAQEVVVTQQLDSDLDFATFQLQSFGFGNLSVDIPAGLSYYKSRIDAASTLGVWVDFEGGISLASGLATWTFRAIDPATGELVEDALAGFLPPNVTSPSGEGFVSYVVRSRSGVASGARIDAQARIVFDTNAPIDTAPIFNTIDALPPASSVTPLPAATYAPQLQVSWSGTDDALGSGIGNYDLYVSEDSGPFALWMTTKDTTAVYPATYDHDYSFYVVARDFVGHEELAPIVADASTHYYGPAWHNPVDPLNVDGIAGIVPLDALLIINELNNRTLSAANGALPAVPPTPGYQLPHWDTSGDNFVTALDALLVVNYLNLPLIPPPGPEGEAVQVLSPGASDVPGSPLVLEGKLQHAAHDRVFAELAHLGSGDAQVSWLLAENILPRPPHTLSAKSSGASSGFEKARPEEIELPWSERLRKIRRATES